MSAMSLVRVLTPIALSGGMRRHLTDCAVYELIDRRLLPWLPRLTCEHVLGLARLPAEDRRHDAALHTNETT